MLLKFFLTFNYTSPVFLVDQSVGFYQQMGLLLEITLREHDGVLPYFPANYHQFTRVNLTASDIADMLKTVTVSSRGKDTIEPDRFWCQGNLFAGPDGIHWIFENFAGFPLLAQQNTKYYDCHRQTRPDDFF